MHTENHVCWQNQPNEMKIQPAQITRHENNTDEAFKLKLENIKTFTLHIFQTIYTDNVPCPSPPPTITEVSV